MTQPYDRVSGLVTKIRNARFGEMVRYLEDLIDSGDWRDYTPPLGYRYQFREAEFDYFLISQEIDTTLVRYAYTCAGDVDDLHAKQIRLADITGDGREPKKGSRRTWQEVVNDFNDEPTGTAKRIQQAFENREAWDRFVTKTISQVARDKDRRRAAISGKGIQANPGRKRWTAEWWDNDTTPAEAIAAKLLKDELLARDVYNKLQAKRVSTYREDKRRSQA